MLEKILKYFLDNWMHSALGLKLRLDLLIREVTFEIFCLKFYAKFTGEWIFVTAYGQGIAKSPISVNSDTLHIAL